MHQLLYGVIYFSITFLRAFLPHYSFRIYVVFKKTCRTADQTSKKCAWRDVVLE